MAQASGSIDDSAQLTDREGDIVGGGGPPTLAFGVEPDDPFVPTELTSGSWADTDGEVVIDAATAKEEGYAVGDKIGVVAKGPVRGVHDFRNGAVPRSGIAGRRHVRRLHAGRGPAAV